MMRSHRALILNWFQAKGRWSSGAVEGFNGKAELTTRKAFGVRLSHLRGAGSRLVSYSWRLTRARTHPQILLTRQKSFNSSLGPWSMRFSWNARSRNPKASAYSRATSATSAPSISNVTDSARRAAKNAASASQWRRASTSGNGRVVLMADPATGHLRGGKHTGTAPAGEPRPAAHPSPIGYRFNGPMQHSTEPPDPQLRPPPRAASDTVAPWTPPGRSRVGRRPAHASRGGTPMIHSLKRLASLLG